MVNIPVVIASGAGSLEDIKEVINKANPSGVAISSLLHYDKFTVSDIKDYLYCFFYTIDIASNAIIYNANGHLDTAILFFMR